MKGLRTRTGYSTQSRLSLRMADLINNGRLAFYFSEALNPADNPLSSSPLEIFAQFDRLARGGRNAPDVDKAKEQRSALMVWIFESKDKGLINEGEVDEALALVKNATKKDSTPTLFRLNSIPSHRPSDARAPDEYLAPDQTHGDIPKLSKRDLAARGESHAKYFEIKVLWRRLVPWRWDGARGEFGRRSCGSQPKSCPRARGIRFIGV